MDRREQLLEETVAVKEQHDLQKRTISEAEDHDDCCCGQQLRGLCQHTLSQFRFRDHVVVPQGAGSSSGSGE